MKACMVVLICVVLVCVCLRAHAQSDGQDPQEVDRAVGTIDGSGYAEVDGQPHQPKSVGSSRGQAIPPSNEKRPPATLVWAARSDALAMDSDDKAQSSALGISSFRPGAQPESSAPLTIVCIH